MEEERLIKPKEFIKITGITYQTLWNWINAGKIDAVRTPTNKYLINTSELTKLNLIKSKPINKINLIYARVSTKQKEDLNRQIERLTQFCSHNNIQVDEIFHDIASGVNFERNKFNKILELILENKISKIIIEHKDRFCSFGFELFENLAKIYHFEFIITTNSPVEIESFENELTNDLISIINNFSTKLYSDRKEKFKELAHILKNL